MKDYRWAPGGQRIAFINEDESKDQATEEEGDEDDCPGLPKPEELTEGDAFNVQTFEFSPGGSEIVYEHRENSDIMSYATADISITDIESRASRKLIEAPGFDGAPQYSPDGKWVLYQTASGNTQSDFYVNGQLKKVAVKGGDSGSGTCSAANDWRNSHRSLPSRRAFILQPSQVYQ